MKKSLALHAMVKNELPNSGNFFFVKYPHRDSLCYMRFSILNYSKEYGSRSNKTNTDISMHHNFQVYHRWKCAAPLYENNRQMPMLIFKVYACVVHDENNRTYAIIDDNGCSLDEEIIPTPEYDIENGVIYTPSKAFR